MLQVRGETLKGLSPLLRGGGAAPVKQMPRYLKIGAAREVRPFLHDWFDLPGPADFLR